MLQGIVKKKQVMLLSVTFWSQTNFVFQWQKWTVRVLINDITDDHMIVWNEVWNWDRKKANHCVSIVYDPLRFPALVLRRPESIDWAKMHEWSVCLLYWGKPIDHIQQTSAESNLKTESCFRCMVWAKTDDYSLCLLFSETLHIQQTTVESKMKNESCSRWQCRYSTRQYLFCAFWNVPKVCRP